MTRKSDNKAGNATVAAVQQSHVAAVQAAKSAPLKPATPQKSAAAAAPLKPAGVQSKPSTPGFTAKPATPQPSKVQAAPAKAAPHPVKAASPSAPVGRKLSQAPIYEMYMVAALFSEPANWTANQAPCHAPHRAAASTRAAKPVLGKQNSAVSQAPTPKPAAANNKAAQKVAPKQAAATKQKAAVKWNSPAGKQLILRPKGELVLFQPLWVQIQVWSVNKSKPVKGRSSKQDRVQQQKQRVAAQRKPDQVVAPKQQPNAQKPLSRQASGVSSKPATPAPVSRNLQKTKAAAAPQKGASSPVDWQTNIWEDFYTSKHSTFKESATPSAKSKPTTPAPKSKPQTPASVKTAKPNSAKGIKHASLKSTIPPPSEAKSPEIFSFVHSPTAGPLKPPSPIFVRKHADGLGHPATFSRQSSSHSAKASPPSIHAARLPKQNSNSSPTGNTPDYFASYMDRPTSPSTNQAPSKRNAASAVPLSPSKQYAAMRATKAKPAPYMTASGMPREMANAWAEGANYKSIQLVNDAEARGIQYGPQPRAASNSGKQKKPVKKQASWFTPHGFAVASAAVVLGGVGIGALMN
ncbi:hypothetical protein HDU77_003484 [Chytriomyces hyalinus]|nr:hypothetical protein HDU77_003484 [Chytriomyces hyalinus]